MHHLKTLVEFNTYKYNKRTLMAKDSRDLLLESFADNQIQGITAADMRSFVNAVYNELFNKLDVRDDLGSNNSNQALSSSQGVYLKQIIDTQSQEIDELKRRVEVLEGIGGATITYNTLEDLNVRVENGLVAEVYNN